MHQSAPPAEPAGLTALIGALQRPQAWPEAAWAGVPPGGRRVAVIQTHISVVFLTAHWAGKLKKPIRLWGLLDYGSPQARLHWCREELRLNRRLAPQLYLGLAAVTGAGEGGEDRAAVTLGPLGVEHPGAEHLVLMRRFRAADTLRERLAAGRAGAAELRALGAHIGRFHRAHPLAPPSPRAPVRAFAAVLHNNVRATAAFVPDLFPAAVHRLLLHHLALALRRSRAVLQRRIERGLAVDGHGDLRLEHVLLDGEIAVVDCVEFNADLRRVDGASDLAFLVMELEAAGHAALVPALLEGYGQPVEAAVMDLFVAYRAHVRAKVEAATSVEAAVGAGQRRGAGRAARLHLALALAAARTGLAPPLLIVLHGLSGSGKSHLATRLAPWLRADHHRSDVIRKRIHGLDPLARPEPHQLGWLYGPEANRRTEAALLERAGASLGQGRSVLLDATHLRAASRAAALALAGTSGAVPLILDLPLSPERLRRRLEQRQRRGDDPSDADAAVLERQRADAEPLGAAERGRAVRVEEATADDPAGVLMALWEQVARGF